MTKMPPSDKNRKGLFGRLLGRNKTEKPVVEEPLLKFSLSDTSIPDLITQNAPITYPGLTEQQREVVSKAIASFGHSGFTVGDVIKLLSNEFDQEEAELIAVTEITRKFAYKAQIKGEKLKKEFGDVPVVKTWFTNNDNHVCPVCRALDGKSVEIDEEFAPDIFIPPAHIGCRCWMSSTTRLAGL
jgi:SPP1 gp7 family putative phage head morphogenesis protein